MGTGASVITVEGAADVMVEEQQRPLDASDVDTPRGVSAKSEVTRLRQLLATYAQPYDGNDLLTAATTYPPFDDSDPNAAVYASFPEEGYDPQTQQEQDSSADIGEMETSTSFPVTPGIEEYLAVRFRAADVDGSGVLSYDEFWRLLSEDIDLGLDAEQIQNLQCHAQWITETGDVTWQTFVELAPELLANLVNSGTSEIESSPNDWCECINGDGTTYFYNKRTQESVWERPAAILLEE